MTRGTSHLRLRVRLVRCCVALHYGTVKRRLCLLLLDISQPNSQGFPPIFEGVALRTRKNFRGNWSQVVPQNNPTVQFNSTQTQPQGQLKTANAPLTNLSTISLQPSRRYKLFLFILFQFIQLTAFLSLIVFY